MSERPPGRRITRKRPGLLRRVGASVATVAATAGLVAFASLGAFEDAEAPFPHSVLVPRGVTPPHPGSAADGPVGGR